MPDFVAPEQLDEAIAAGLTPTGGDVAVRAADGRIVNINAQDYAALQGEHQGAASLGEVRQYQAQQAAAAEQARLQAQSGRAFWEAAGSTAWDQTLGLVGPIQGRDLMSRVAGMGAPVEGEAAMYGADDPRRWFAERAAERDKEAAYNAESRAVAQANPNAYGWGKFAGTVGGGLAMSAATGGFGGLGAAGTLGRLGVGGLEGGIAGLTSAREEAWLKNEQLTSSAAWDAITHGAMFGAAVSGGFMALGAGYRALRGGAEAAAQGFEAAGAAGTAGAREGAETLAGALERKSGGVMGTLKRMFGHDEEAREALETLSSQEARGLATSGPGNLVKLSRGLKGAVDDLENSDSMIRQAMNLKTEGVERLVNPALVQAQRAAVPQVTSRVVTGISSALEEAGDLVTPAMRKQLGGVVRDASEFHGAAGEMTGGQLFLRTDGIKRGLQDGILNLRQRAQWFKGQGGDAASARDLMRVASKLEDIERAMREGNLENPEVWGQSLAGFQREFNQGWVEALSGTGKYSRQLLREGDTIFETGGRELRADSAGIDAAVKSLGTAAADDLSDGIAQRVLGQQKMLGALKKSGLIDAEMAARTERALDTVQQVHGTLLKHAEARRALQTLTEAGDASPAAQMLGMVPFVGKAASAAARPDTGVRMLAMLESATNRTDTTLGQVAQHALGIADSAAGGAERGAFGAVLGTAREVSARGSRAAVKHELQEATGVREKMKEVARTGATVGGITAGFWRDSDSPTQAYQARLREVQSKADPAAAMQHATQMVGPIGRDAPKFAAAFAQQLQTAAQFLASKAPAPVDRPGELQGNRKLPIVSKDAVDRWARYYTAVTKPVECAKLLAAGQLRSEHVEALEAVHPEVLSALQNRVLEQAQTTDKPIPPGRLRQLDILLHMGGRADPSVRPDNLRIMAQAAQHQQEQQQAKQSPRQMTAAKATQTGTEQLARG